MTRAPSVLRLPAGVELSMSARRLAGFVLEPVLALVTLGIGLAVWSLIVRRNGQTPAKQVLGMTVVAETTRKASGWWRMLLRELVLKSALGAIPSLLVSTNAPRSYWWVALPLGIALYCWLLHQLERGPSLPRPHAVEPSKSCRPLPSRSSGPRSTCARTCRTLR